jgi:hypothetical protein
VEDACSDIDASSISSFRSFLSWASGFVAADAQVGLVVLGHGGGVMQICPEEVTMGSGALRWMDLDDASAALVEFNAGVGGRLAFVFLQNCCKATLPALWSFRHLQCRIVASPTIIGAPNTYYSALIFHLFTCPSASPASAAATICHSEEPQDFALLSVFCCDRLLPFALALDAFAAAAAPHIVDDNVFLSLSHAMRRFFIEYAFTDEHGRSYTDCYVDVMAACFALQSSLIGSTKPPPHLIHQLQVSFADFQELRVVSPLAGSYNEFCGLSLLFPPLSSPATLHASPSDQHLLPKVNRLGGSDYVTNCITTAAAHATIHKRALNVFLRFHYLLTGCF